MNTLNKIGKLVAMMALVAGSAHGGSAIGVIGTSPLTCKTSLVSGTQMEDVQTIISKTNELYFRIGQEFPKGFGCTLYRSPVNTDYQLMMACAHDGKDAQQVFTRVAERGRLVHVAFKFDGINYRLQVATLGGHPALPRQLLKEVDGVVSNPPTKPFVEIMPAQCSVPPGF